MKRVSCAACLSLLILSACSSKNNPTAVIEKPAPVDSTVVIDSTTKKDSLSSHPPNVTTSDTTYYQKISISITGLEFEWLYYHHDNGVLTPIEHRGDTSYI